VCYPNAAKNGNALRVNCDTNVVEEMGKGDNCEGLVAATWAGAGEGDCLSNGVDARTMKFSCTTSSRRISRAPTRQLTCSLRSERGTFARRPRGAD